MQYHKGKNTFTCVLFQWVMIFEPICIKKTGFEYKNSIHLAENGDQRLILLSILLNFIQRLKFQNKITTFQEVTLLTSSIKSNIGV